MNNWRLSKDLIYIPQPPFRLNSKFITTSKLSDYTCKKKINILSILYKIWIVLIKRSKMLHSIILTVYPLISFWIIFNLHKNLHKWWCFYLKENLMDIKAIVYEFIVLHFGPCLAKEGRIYIYIYVCRIGIAKHSWLSVRFFPHWQNARK